MERNKLGFSLAWKERKIESLASEAVLSGYSFVASGPGPFFPVPIFNLKCFFFRFLIWRAWLEIWAGFVYLLPGCGAEHFFSPVYARVT